MILIDGSYGEGGGQIIRSALTLSLLTGKPFRADRVRAGRENPGLQNQHLMAINAAAKISDADTAGTAKGSRQFTFRPGKVKPGTYEFRIGTAGSTGLVMQTILLPLILGDTSSKITIEGGTHNPWAPPFDFLERTFLPLINQMGPVVTAVLHKYGFYPSGGGEVTFQITPASTLAPLHLNEDDGVKAITAKVVLVNLPEHIAKREAEVLQKSLPKIEHVDNKIEILQPTNCRGQGNFIALHLKRASLVETFTAIGGKGIRAEEGAD